MFFLFRSPMASADVWLCACALVALMAGAGCTETAIAPGVGSGVLSAANHSSSDAHWSSWRGGTLQGVSPGTGPQQWSRSENVRWFCPLPGEGNSSPVLSMRHVYLSTAIADHGNKLSVLAVRRDDGRIDWISPVELAQGSAHRKAGWASATPACAAGRVFAYFGAAGLVSLNAHDGQIVWHRRFPEATHQWGAASSPVLVNELVVQLVESEVGSSFLTAVRQADGVEVWRTERESQGCWSTPAVVRATGRVPQIVVNGTGHKDGSPGWIIGYDLSTGRELWRLRGSSDVCVPTAIVSGDIVVCGSGSNGPLMALQVTDEGPRVLWQRPVGGTQVPTGLVCDDRLYLIGDGGTLSCRDLHSGSVLWHQRLGGAVSASLLASRSHLYVTNEHGVTYVVARGPRFQLVAGNPLEERCLATPALADGELFVRTESGLYCIGSGPVSLSASQWNETGDERPGDDGSTEPKLLADRSPTPARTTASLAGRVNSADTADLQTE